MPKSEKRKYDFYFKAPFIKSDTTVYVLPSDYASETLPPPVTLSCEYGSYSTSYSYVKERNELISVARLELSHNIIPAEKYSEVKKFFDSVISEDGQKLVIRKN